MYQIIETPHHAAEAANQEAACRSVVLAAILLGNALKIARHYQVDLSPIDLTDLENMLVDLASDANAELTDLKDALDKWTEKECYGVAS